jgi:hypothetical protein
MFNNWSITPLAAKVRAELDVVDAGAVRQLTGGKVGDGLERSEVEKFHVSVLGAGEDQVRIVWMKHDLRGNETKLTKLIRNCPHDNVVTKVGFD